MQAKILNYKYDPETKSIAVDLEFVPASELEHEALKWLAGRVLVDCEKLPHPNNDFLGLSVVFYKPFPEPEPIKSQDTSDRDLL